MKFEEESMGTQGQDTERSTEREFSRAEASEASVAAESEMNIPRAENPAQTPEALFARVEEMQASRVSDRPIDVVVEGAAIRNRLAEIARFLKTEDSIAEARETLGGSATEANVGQEGLRSKLKEVKQKIKELYEL